MTRQVDLGKAWALGFSKSGSENAGKFVGQLSDALRTFQVPYTDPKTLPYQQRQLHFSCFDLVLTCAKDLGILRAQYDIHSYDHRLPSDQHDFVADLAAYLHHQPDHIPVRLRCVNAKRLRRVARQFHKQHLGDAEEAPASPRVD